MSNNSSASVQITLGVLTLIGVCVTVFGTGIGDRIIGKSVPAAELETAKAQITVLTDEKKKAEDAFNEVTSTLTSTKASLDSTTSELETLKAKIAENQRGPQVFRLTRNSERLVDGTDLKLYLTAIQGSGDDLTAIVEYNGNKYNVKAGPNGGSSIVTKADRNCDVSATEVTSDLGIFVVDCKATF